MYRFLCEMEALKPVFNLHCSSSTYYLHWHDLLSVGLSNIELLPLVFIKYLQPFRASWHWSCHYIFTTDSAKGIFPLVVPLHFAFFSGVKFYSSSYAGLISLSECCSCQVALCLLDFIQCCTLSSGWLAPDASTHAFSTCLVRLPLCQVPGRQWYTSSS